MKNQMVALFALSMLMAIGFAEPMASGPDACYTAVGASIRWTCGQVSESDSVWYLPALQLEEYTQMKLYPPGAFAMRTVAAECPKENGIPICA